MAICWNVTIEQFDNELVFAPERYSARRNAHLLEVSETVPLHEIAQLKKTTSNPAQTNPNGEYVVLDTTHAVEGRIQFSGAVVRGNAVGSVKRPVSAGSVMVSRLRTYLRQIAYVDEGFTKRHGARVICSTEFYVLEPIGEQSLAFLVPFLLSENVQKVFAYAQEGGHHPRIHADILMEIRVPAKVLELRETLDARVVQAIHHFRSAEATFADCAQMIRGIGS